MYYTFPWFFNKWTYWLIGCWLFRFKLKTSSSLLTCPLITSATLPLDICKLASGHLTWTFVELSFKFVFGYFKFQSKSKSGFIFVDYVNKFKAWLFDRIIIWLVYKHCDQKQNRNFFIAHHLTFLFRLLLSTKVNCINFLFLKKMSTVRSSKHSGTCFSWHQSKGQSKVKVIIKLIVTNFRPECIVCTCSTFSLSVSVFTQAATK